MTKQVIMSHVYMMLTGNLNYFPIIRVDHREQFAEVKSLAQQREVKHCSLHKKYRTWVLKSDQEKVYVCVKEENNQTGRTA